MKQQGIAVKTKEIRGRHKTTSSDGELWGPSLERLFSSLIWCLVGGPTPRAAFFLGLS